MYQEKKTEIELGGRTLSFSTGKVAKQADGAVWVRYGDCIVQVTACMDDRVREGVDFLPLTVDYREYTFAGGKIPGGFFKREGRPGDFEVLTSRLIDRPLRPLFPEGYHHETQIIAMLLSTDFVEPTDIMALNGASLALLISRIPFTTAVGAVRIGLIDDQLVVNPTTPQLESCDLNLTVAGTKEAICMVEAGGKQVSEERVVQALELAHSEIKRLVAKQEEFAALIAPAKVTVEGPEKDLQRFAEVEAQVAGQYREAMLVPGKLEKYAAMDKVEENLLEAFEEDDPQREEVKRYCHDIMVNVFRSLLVKEGRRVDGRLFDEIRPVWCEVGVLPRTHGSAIFTRGETQALANCTLGTASDTQRLSGLYEGTEKRFLLHYNFPPFSVGEVKFLRNPGRREIGHGALAEKAVTPLLPDDLEFPYTIRVVSDIMESNGSSSQATICGSSLALMDAGVPMKATVAGIAMGLVLEGEDYAILTDIAGLEDHYGDMDFKVAGTRDGITALQMDIKVSGISFDILRKALQQAHKARMQLLDAMESVLPGPREEINSLAPRIYSIMIPRTKIGDLIGPGGKNVRAIQETTGVDVNIEDDGTVTVASNDAESAQQALEMIRSHVEEPEIGKVYMGTVKRIEPYGAFVEILPGQDGLLHVSEIDWKRVENVEDYLKLGDRLEVKLLESERNGKLRLSRKVLLEKPEGWVEPPKRERRPPRSGDRDRGRGGDRRGGDRDRRRPPRR